MQNTALPQTPQQPQPRFSRSFLFFCGAVVVFGILGIVFRFLTPQRTSLPTTEFVSTNFNETVTKYKGISFIGEQPTIPEKFSVGRSSAQKLSEQQVVDQVIATYSLTQPDTSLQIWSSAQYYFAKDPYTNKYSFAPLETASSSGQIVNIDSATQTATEFISKTLPGLKLSPISADAKYLSVVQGVDIDEVEKDEATAVRIPFSQSIDGYPLFYKNSFAYPFEVIVSSSGEILKFEFFPEFSNLVLDQKMNSISLEQSLQNIEKGKASIISVNYEKDQLSLEEITSATLQKVTIEYRVDETNSFVYPFFRFIGVAKNNIGDNLEVEIITPAVATSE